MSGDDNDKYSNLIVDKIGDFQISSPPKPLKFTTSFFDDVKFIPVNRNEECPICYSDIDNSTGKCTTKCGHTFCSKCFAQSLQRSVACPLCRNILAEEIKEPVELSLPFFDNNDEDQITTEVFRTLLFGTHCFRDNLIKSIADSMGPRPLTQEHQKLETIIIEKILSQNDFWECFHSVSREACFRTANWFYNNLIHQED